MSVSVKELRSQKEILNLTTESLYCGRKVVFRLINDEIEAEFMDELAKIAATTGMAVGIASGAISALIILDEIVGFVVAGPAGVAAVMAIGSIVGSVFGTMLGYTLGAWFAHYLYRIAGRDGKVEVKKLCSFFGLRKNRVQIKIVRAS